jgi:hypothetical protein
MGVVSFTPLYTKDISHGTYCIGCWMGPRAGLGVVKRKKNLLPLPEIELRLLGRKAHSLVAILIEPSRLISNSIRSEIAQLV